MDDLDEGDVSELVQKLIFHMKRRLATSDKRLDEDQVIGDFKQRLADSAVQIADRDAQIKELVRQVADGKAIKADLREKLTTQLQENDRMQQDLT